MYRPALNGLSQASMTPAWFSAMSVCNQFGFSVNKSWHFLSHGKSCPFLCDQLRLCLAICYLRPADQRCARRKRNDFTVRSVAPEGQWLCVWGSGGISAPTQPLQAQGEGPTDDQQGPLSSYLSDIVVSAGLMTGNRSRRPRWQPCSLCHNW